jgi:hypothetical protein
MRSVLAAVLTLIVAACAQQPAAPPPAAETPPGFPDAYYRQAAAQGTPVMPVDPAASLVAIEVYRGGSLARLGHDHVIASHDVRGFVAPSAKRADLYFRLDTLVIDEPALRKEAGFDTQPTDEDIAGTRRNMLSAMDAAAFPFALVRIAAGEGAAAQPMRVTVSVHGVERTVQAPVELEVRRRIACREGSSRTQADRFRHHAAQRPRRRDPGSGRGARALPDTGRRAGIGGRGFHAFAGCPIGHRTALNLIVTSILQDFRR